MLLNPKLKSLITKLWDRFWSGGISNRSMRPCMWSQVPNAAMTAAVSLNVVRSSIDEGDGPLWHE